MIVNLSKKDVVLLIQALNDSVDIGTVDDGIDPAGWEHHQHLLGRLEKIRDRMPEPFGLKVG